MFNTLSGTIKGAAWMSEEVGIARTQVSGANARFQRLIVKDALTSSFKATIA